MTQVYVRWYGNVVQGEMLEGEFLGMKQVRIPLDGRNPVALFMPWSVYESVEKMQETAKEVYSYQKEFPKPEDVIHPDLPMPYPADDYMNLEQFKRDNWDHERGHLRTDKFDEFYQLWRKAIVPFGYAEAKPAETPAPKRIVSDERMEQLKEQLKARLDQLPEKKMRCRKCANLDYDYINGRHETRREGGHFCGLHGRAHVDPDSNQVNLDRRGGCGFIQKEPSPKPSRKMLRSTGQQVFQDSTQLALFD